MNRFLLPLGLLSAITLSGCVIDAGDDGWDESMSLEDRTRLAVEACGRGQVAEVTSKGFSCKTGLGN